MNPNILAVLASAVLWLFSGAAHADTEWNSREYDLYAGDFDGDGRSDVLYVAKDPSKASGIARSDGAGPNIPWQSWLGNHLGIPWHSNLYRVLVADFNGDRRSDLFLQRKTAGDHYLLFANDNGKFTAIKQTVGNQHLGYDWSQSEHLAHAGDFTGDGYADLFLQGARPSSTHFVITSDSNGQFTFPPRQTWTDATWGAFKWSVRNSNIFIGDFNGDRRSDLLVQAKPAFTLIDFDVTIPVPTYGANTFGVAFAVGLEQPFTQVGIQQWSRNAFGVDWSQTGSDIVVGDFDGNGTMDVLLQARHSSRPSYLVSGYGSGAVFRAGSALATNVAWGSDSYRLIVGNFDGSGGVGAYWQATSSSGVNYFANAITGGSVSLTAHNPAAPTGVVPATAAGHTIGAFAVSHTGAATYSIPIVVPPGVSSMQPDLTINYQSGSGNGLLGVGWALGGFSEISRCGKTIAQDGTNATVTLTAADRFCLNGNKLRLTGGVYGASGSTYQTELESFSRFTAHSTAGNGPAHFTVEAKNGLTYEYGSSADSRIEAVNSSSPSTAHTWALNKVVDRHGNTMTISYHEDGAPNGSFRPKEILYTSNANAGVSSAYKVILHWVPRSTSDILTAYEANGLVKEIMRLDRIETQYNQPGAGWRLVRKYQLSYNTSGSTPRTRLGAIQECDGNAACLAPTTITWQDGDKGWVISESISPSHSTALMEYSYAIDINGDGRDDLVFPQTVNGNRYWHYMQSLLGGGFSGAQNTGISAGDDTNAQYAKAQVIDYYSEGRQSLLVDVPGQITRQLLRWNGTGLALTSTNLSVPLTGKEWVADFDGDGRADLLYMTHSSGTGYISVQKNLGAIPGEQATFAMGQPFYSTPTTSLDPFTGDPTNWTSRVLDFNGDGRADFVYSSTSTDCEFSPCTYETNWYLLTSTGSSFVHSATWGCRRASSACPVTLLVGDFNGDGMTDVLNQVFYPQSNGQIMYGGGGASLNVPLPGDFNTKGFVEDYDRDGIDDVFYAPSATSGSWYVLRSTGNGFEAPVAIPLSSTSANNTVRVFDIDGDGLRELGFKNVDYRVKKRKGKVPDLAAAIADGFGNRVDISYAPLTDPGVYTRGTGAIFPLTDLQSAMYVVKSYSASDGIGGSYSVTQRYAGLRAHLQGRGLLGFESRESVDSRTGIKSTWTFRQDFPFIGFVPVSTTYQPNGRTIAMVSSAPSQLPVEGGLYEERRFPYTSTSLQVSHDVNPTDPEIDGVMMTKVETTTTMDSYGNPKTVTNTTTDLFSVAQPVYTTTQTSTYADASCAWRGFATKQEVTSAVPGYAAQTRTVEYEKDASHPAACRIHKEIVEPNDNAVKVTNTFGYDTFGHVNSKTVSAENIESRVTTTSYGSQGVFPVTLTQSATGTFSHTEIRTHDYALGVPETSTDPNGLLSSWRYDGFGRVVKETRPDNTKTEWSYGACGVANGYCGDSRLRYQVTKRELDATDPGSAIRTSVQRFDAYGRALYEESQTSSGAFAVVATNYDNQGRVSQRSQPYFAGFSADFTTFTYDLLGRHTLEQRRISEAANGTQTVKYTYNGPLHTYQDANGRITSKQFNAIGQVIAVADAAGGGTTYEYDQFGNLRKTKDPAGNVIESTYNIRGFRMSTIDPNMGRWRYTYYPTGELWTQTDAKDNVVTMTYDRLSRPKTRSEPEGTTTYHYGDSAAAKNIGQLASVTAPGGYSESFVYDSLGRLQNATTNADAASFVTSSSYDSTTGLLDTVTYPTSTAAVPGSRFKLKYEYEYGHMKRARDFNAPSTVYWENVATNAAGQTIDEVYGNGVRTYSDYDGITGLLASRSAGSSGQVQNLSYQWDKVGNLMQRRDATLLHTEDFTYDEINRLKTSTLNNVANLSLTYYANGNIKTKSDVGTYAYPTQGVSSVRPHAVTSAGSRSFAYDANGNMSSRDGAVISWYSYNKPSRINRGGSYSQFYYGVDRSRYKQIAHTAAGASLPAGTETTLYIGGLFEKVTKPSSVVEYKHYIVAGGEAVAIRTLRSGSGTTDDTRYLHKDHLGSVDAITNEAGTVLQRLSYDAFGKRRNAAAWSGALTSGDWANIAGITHRGFTFHEELDNLDLINMNGRVYDPDLGRFISADPFIQAPLMSQSLNRYSYVMNNPLSLIDPSGYSWLSKAWKSVGKFVKKYWREILAVVITVVSMGTLGPIAGGFWGAVASGATAGAIYGATITALYGGNFGDILRGALTGAVVGGITAGISYGMGQLFSSPAQAAPVEKPIDFGVKALEQAGSDTVKTQISSTGLNADTIAAIGAAYNAMSELRRAGINARIAADARATKLEINAMSDRAFANTYAYGDHERLLKNPLLLGAEKQNMISQLDRLFAKGMNGFLGEGGEFATDQVIDKVSERVGFGVLRIGKKLQDAGDVFKKGSERARENVPGSTLVYEGIQCGVAAPAEGCIPLFSVE